MKTITKSVGRRGSGPQMCVKKDSGGRNERRIKCV